MREEGDMVVLCEDNTGVSDELDKGISYLFDDNNSPFYLIWVWNKFGVKKQYLKNRFLFEREL